DIQLNQNLSDIKAAEQKARFARMDLEKFLGDKSTREVIEQLELLEGDAPAETNFVNATATVASSPTNIENTNISGGALQVVALPASSPGLEGSPSTTNTSPRPERRIDFLKYADPDLLG